MKKSHRERKLDYYLKLQLKDFKKKFGRDPLPGEPVFFDPDADTPTEMSEEASRAEILEVMRETGFPPEHIYAFEKTGILFSEDGPVDPSDVAIYQAALDEFREMERKKGK